MSEKQRLWAFWKYDRWPFLLGGEIDHFTAGGSVYITSYQSAFKPVLILSYKEGKSLLESLITMGAQLEADTIALRQSYTKKANELLEEYPIEIELSRGVVLK